MFKEFKLVLKNEDFHLISKKIKKLQSKKN